MPWRDDDLDEESWDDDPAGERYGSAAHPSTIRCPHCRADIYADSERCPKCGTYLSAEDAVDSPPGRKPWWIIIGSLAVLGIVYSWVRFNH